ncbi:MAG: hypothetical protein U9N87_04965 [Planctomycetota bacterium]|nr:hypothetical protein [Planctomycetota bacterium]
MSIGPSAGLAASAAATPLAKASSSDSDRVSQEVSAQQRQTVSENKAESAAGIGETDGEDHETEDRDADGRKLWEESPEGKKQAAEDSQQETPPRVKDVSGQSGNLLDLSG